VKAGDFGVSVTFEFKEPMNCDGLRWTAERRARLGPATRPVFVLCSAKAERDVDSQHQSHASPGTEPRDWVGSHAKTCIDGI
jgi:hypothetical protein